MTKIVVNKCYGGFSLSNEAMYKYALYCGFKLYEEGEGMLLLYYKDEALTEHISYRDIERNDPMLIKVVERLGKAANGSFAELNITEIPDGVDWQIGEYDGQEWVEEKHKTW